MVEGGGKRLLISWLQSPSAVILEPKKLKSDTVSTLSLPDALPILPDHLTCLLRKLYAGQEATVKTGHGTTDRLQIGKRVHQGCILTPCLFNLYEVYIMRNTGLQEAQAAIKIAGRNISNIRYADDTILMAESEEELNSLLLKVKEENEKAGLKLNIQ